MAWMIKPGTIDLLCRDQESIPNQQKSTTEASAKEETLWSQFKRCVRNIWKKVQPVLPTINVAVSSLATLLTTWSKYKRAIARCH